MLCIGIWDAFLSALVKLHEGAKMCHEDVKGQVIVWCNSEPETKTCGKNFQYKLTIGNYRPILCVSSGNSEYMFIRNTTQS